MRIVGDIPHGIMKITLMEMNHKMIVKFEHDFMEQTYKFPQFSKVQEVKDRIDEKFCAEVEEIFLKMAKVRLVDEKEESNNEDFPEIL